MPDSASPPLAPATPTDVGLAFLDAIVRGDVAAIAALLDPAATWWVQGWGAMLRDLFLASLTATIDRATMRGLEIISTTAQDDRVAIEARGSFAFAEGDYRNSYIYLLRIANGRIIEGREYLDTAVAARFFG